MSELTDPAKELHNLCSQLVETGVFDESTDAVIAAKFKVIPWSVQLYDIVFIVRDKIDETVKLINEEKYDSIISEKSRYNHEANLNKIKSAFGKDYLYSNWSNCLTNVMTSESLNTLMYLSDAIIREDKTIKLTQIDIDSIWESIRSLIKKLENLKDDKNVFLVDVLIEGLMKFGNRLDAYEFLGINYTIESFADLVKNYISLEKCCNDSFEEEHVDLHKSIYKDFSNVFELIKKCKDVKEVTEFVEEMLMGCYKMLETSGLFQLGHAAMKQITHQS
jgi:hypothetical protein